MQARMENPVVPEAMQALLALAKSAEQGGVPRAPLRSSGLEGRAIFQRRRTRRAGAG